MSVVPDVIRLPLVISQALYAAFCKNSAISPILFAYVIIFSYLCIVNLTEEAMGYNRNKSK